MLDDIRQHFKQYLGITFTEFIGTPERPNLQFEVKPVGSGDKPRAIDALLTTHLSDTPGGAVVFVASRAKAEEFSEYLEACNWACAYYHAGLQPNEKKDIQDSFQRRRRILYIYSHQRQGLMCKIYQRIHIRWRYKDTIFDRQNTLYHLLKGRDPCCL